MNRPPNSDELLSTVAIAEAVVDACKAELRRLALAEYELNRRVVSWRHPGVGKVETPLSRDATTVVSQELDDLMDWLLTHYPDEVAAVTKLVLRHPTFLDGFLANLTPVDGNGEPLDLRKVKPGETAPCKHRDGEVVPGVVFTKGGRPLTPSVTPDAGLRRQVAALAVAYATTGAPLPQLSQAPSTDLDPTGKATNA